MISDFLWIDRMENEIMRYNCFLPNPNLEEDDEMVACGVIDCFIGDVSSNLEITVIMFDNFPELCVDDTYQRKLFVKTIAYILKSKFCINTDSAFFRIIDNWGESEGTIDEIDSIVRSL